MKFVTDRFEIRKILDQYRKEGKSIGFTPTMGALHDGHISLIKASNKENDISVCSVFVNPTQFNEASDLEKYPRTIEADSKLLKENGLDVLYFPEVEDIYPKDLETEVKLDFEGLDEAMEGKFRPGHFKGVAQVVKRFLDIVEPDRLYMGQKDFQQFTIIDFMIKKLRIKTDLVVCPIKREVSGLAMSSRNVRLTQDHKERAKVIYQTLSFVKKNIRKIKLKDLEAEAMKRLNIDGFRPEYFEIINGNNLRALSAVRNCKYVVACTAVWAGDVRLIDNMILIKE